MVIINFSVEKLVPLCAEFDVDLNSDILKRLEIYANLLIEWNEKINLTSITSPEDVVFKHFYDCILFFKHINPQNGASLIDVGTGAGFPGLVLKIVRPDIETVLLDSLNKRLNFLNEVIAQCGLDGITTLHMRAEDAGKSPLYRQKFDISCARAVARLAVLSEYCLPFVKVGGIFAAMKGPAVVEEVKEAEKGIKLLGGGKPVIEFDTLTGNETRGFVKIEKISQTPTKYPRKPKEISKQPL